MDEFDLLLSHYDQRLAQCLDRKYLEEEQTYTAIRHGSRQMPKDVPPVDAEVRRKQVSHAPQKTV